MVRVLIEKAVPADAAAMIEFFRQVGAESDNLSFGAEGLPIAPEAEAEYISGFQHSKDGVMLVARLQGRIIGNASLNRLPRRMSHRGEVAVCVLKEFWNKGIGGMLMENIIHFARENEFELIELQVRSDNSAAIHLYEKYGFERLCRHPAFFKIGNDYIDFDVMRLKIR